MINRQILYNEYWVNKKSINQIGLEYNIRSPKYIFNKLNIPKRTLSEAVKIVMSKPGMKEKISITTKLAMLNPIIRQKISKSVKIALTNPDIKIKLSKIRKGKPTWNKGLKGYKSGKDNCNWKGGITDLYDIIRTLDEYYVWRNRIYERDNYFCQNCNKKGEGDLNAHHIKPFSILLREFLQQYNQFSPIEDKETLVRLAITYSPFWELSNGKTLCEDCHNLLKKETYKLIQMGGGK